MHGGLGYTLRLFKPPTLSFPQLASYHQRRSQSPDPKLLTALSQGSVAIINHRPKQRQAIIRSLVSFYARRHQQVLTVVPEVNLLPGPGMAYHAGLRPSVVSAIWHGVKAGQIEAVRGTQKALFLPFSRLGLIIIEEEQNPAHKLWDQYPRLHNIDGVQALANIYHCPLLYLSSFPSWRLAQAVTTAAVVLFANNPLILKSKIIPFSFDDKVKKYALPHEVMLKLRAWSSAKKRTLLLYNRLDNKKILQTLRANLSAVQLGYCQLSTSRVFAQGVQSFDRLVWLFPEQSITFPDFRSVENAHITVSRLQQLIKTPASPVYLVTRQPPLLERIFNNPDSARDHDCKLRQRLLLPPFHSQVRLKISAKKPSLVRRKSQEICAALLDRTKQLPPAQASSILVRGPYESISPPKDPNQRFLILRGPLHLLTKLYVDLPIDSAELTPHRLL